MNKTTFRGIALALLIAVPGFASADGAQDFMYQTNQDRFFDLPQNARTFSMAGSSVATSADSSSVLGNPAGLGWMKDAEVSGTYFYQQTSGADPMTYEDMTKDTNAGHILGAFPLSPYTDALPEYGNLGMGWSGSRGTTDDPIDEGSYYAWRLHAAYAKALNEAWSLGYSINYQHRREDTHIRDLSMDDGIRQALGAQYKLSKDTTFGLSTAVGFGHNEYKNFAPYDTWEKEKVRYTSWGMEGGVAQKLWTALATASVGYTGYWRTYESDGNAWSFRLGAEQPIVDWFTLRAGYRYQANMGFEYEGQENAKYNAVSFGAGLVPWKYTVIDYAAEYRAVGDGDWTHMVTLTVPFSLCM